MSTSGRQELEGNAALAQSVAHSLEQVREILFGPQHREFARRLARTEAHIAAQAEEIRNETRRRLEMLEAHLRKESEALTVSMEHQRSAQLEALNKAARESHEAGGSLELRIQKLEETIARVQRDFRQQLLDQAKAFIDEIRRTRDELTTAVQREIMASLTESTETAAGPESTPEETDRHEPWERPSEAA
jgi:hemerythrin-like domain-containing protein